MLCVCVVCACCVCVCVCYVYMFLCVCACECVGACVSVCAYVHVCGSGFTACKRKSYIRGYNLSTMNAVLEKNSVGDDT